MNQPYPRSTTVTDFARIMKKVIAENTKTLQKKALLQKKVAQAHALLERADPEMDRVATLLQLFPRPRD